MARRDFRAYSSTIGCSDSVQAFPLTAGASFDEGEPVVLTAGSVLEATDDPAEVVGIAAARSTDVDGTVLGAGAMVAVTLPVDTQLWQTRNFATDGAGTLVAPTVANALGASAGFSLTGGVWSLDTGTINLLVSVEQVLNARGQPLPTGAGPGVSVVFRFLS